MVAIQLLVILLALNRSLGSNPEKIYYDIEKAAEYFEDFIKEYEKQYHDEKEKAEKFEVFKMKLEEINRLNEDNPDMVYGITMFTDMTSEEFRRSFKKFPIIARASYCEQRTDKEFSNSTDPPCSFDWTQRHKVTAAKNQNQCGSCWAFASTGAVESQFAIKHGKLVSLSEQQLVDCVPLTSCKYGGRSELAFSSLIEQGGQMLEKDYLYEAVTESDKFPCRYDKSKAVAVVKSCSYYNLETERALKEALVHKGPLVVSIDGKALGNFEHFKHGILELCSDDLNHEVLLVGYGEENGSPYWILKNSWGASWGNGGFFKIKRGGPCRGFDEIVGVEVA